MNQKELKEKLDRLYKAHNHVGFIDNDPVGIPKQFSKKEDVEISAFFAAIFAWGQRVTIINKTNELLHRMEGSPYEFITNHSDKDLKNLKGFVHRTFNEDDLLYFVHRLKRFYAEEESLEHTFSKHLSKDDKTIEPALIGFYIDFFDDEFALKRTHKHIASPAKNSTCKRLCMYLRWMVRKDAVDYGIWKSIDKSQLMMPYDVHVERMAHKLGLVKRKQRDWKTVVELTSSLRKFDAADPVKYDFSLFGESILGNS